MLQEEMDKRLTTLAKRMGKENAQTLLQVLGKQKKFMDAIESEVGQELLKDLISTVHHIIGLILNEKEDESDRANLRVCMALINKWQTRIKNYNNKHQEFLIKSS